MSLAPEPAGGINETSRKRRILRLKRFHAVHTRGLFNRMLACVADSKKSFSRVNGTTRLEQRTSLVGWAVNNELPRALLQLSH